LLQGALEYGFTHSEITLISTLCKYAKKRLPSYSHIQKYADLLPEPNTLNALNYMLSLSISLLSHRPKNLDFELKFDNGVLEIDSKEPLRLSKETVGKLDSIENLKIRF